MKVRTSRYQNGPGIIESGLAPIRVTLGAPRFKLSYPLAGSLMDLAPDREWFHADTETFTQKMVAKMMRRGPTEIAGEIEALSDGYPGAVLLCYEKWPDSCHRHTVAEWLTVNLGWRIEELVQPRSKPRAARPATSGKPAEQTTLFEMPVGEASRNVVDKATSLILAGRVHRGIGGAYMVEASSGPHGYNVTVDPPACDCKWGESANPSACSHLLAARYIEEYGAAPAARASG